MTTPGAQRPRCPRWAFYIRPPYFAPIGSFRCALFLCAVRAVLAELGALSFARSRSDPPLRVVAHQYVAHTETLYWALYWHASIELYWHALLACFY